MSTINLNIDGRVYSLTTEHAASSYGIPVLVDEETGVAYGRNDVLPGYADAASVVDLHARAVVNDEVIPDLATERAATQLVISYLRGSGLERNWQYGDLQ